MAFSSWPDDKTALKFRTLSYLLSNKALPSVEFCESIIHSDVFWHILISHQFSIPFTKKLLKIYDLPFTLNEIMNEHYFKLILKNLKNKDHKIILSAFEHFKKDINSFKQIKNELNLSFDKDHFIEEVNSILRPSGIDISNIKFLSNFRA